MTQKAIMVLAVAVVLSSLVVAFGLVTAANTIGLSVSKIQLNAPAPSGGNNGGQLAPTQPPAPQVDFNELSKTFTSAEGSLEAPVTIVEFSDFQCPFCRVAYEETLKQIRSEYIETGKVRLLYRNFPLSFHPMAEISAEGGFCAQEQNKFWEYHNTLFDEQHKQDAGGSYGTIPYTKDDLVNWAGLAGLDKTAFTSCIDSGKYKTDVEADVAAGIAAGVSGTPSFFVNGQLLVGAQPYTVFKQAIETELARA